jgi:probable HAF family extracellular repeat protein
MRRFLWLSLAALVVASIAVTSSGGATQAEARWVVTDLGTLKGRKGESTATAINEQGQVVGASDVKGGTSHAFHWANGRMRDLGAVRGLGESEATDINERGQIVGSSYVWDENGRIDRSRPLLWDNGRMQALARPAGRAGAAWAINGEGSIVGFVEIDKWGPDRHAVLWQKGTMRDLGAGSDPDSEATAINEASQVVGVTGTIDPNAVMFESSGFLWENGVMRNLGNLASGWSGWVAGLNDRGQIVGMRRGHATVWESGEARDLATSRGEYSEATDINDRGQIVGSWARNADADERAALWQSARRTLLPNLRGGTTSKANAINNRGQIVGWAETRGGDWHAVLWTLKR